MSTEKEEDDKQKDQLPSCDTLKDKGVDYGSDENGRKFYKYEDKWYLVDTNDNVKRIK